MNLSGGIARGSMALPAFSTQYNMAEVCSLALKLQSGIHPQHFNSDNQLAQATTK